MRTRLAMIKQDGWILSSPSPPSDATAPTLQHTPLPLTSLTSSPLPSAHRAQIRHIFERLLPTLSSPVGHSLPSRRTTPVRQCSKPPVCTQLPHSCNPTSTRPISHPAPCPLCPPLYPTLSYTAPNPPPIQPLLHTHVRHMYDTPCSIPPPDSCSTPPLLPTPTHLNTCSSLSSQHTHS